MEKRSSMTRGLFVKWEDSGAPLATPSPASLLERVSLSPGWMQGQPSMSLNQQHYIIHTCGRGSRCLSWICLLNGTGFLILPTSCRLQCFWSLSSLVFEPGFPRKPPWVQVHLYLQGESAPAGPASLLECPWKVLWITSVSFTCRLFIIPRMNFS